MKYMDKTTSTKTYPTPPPRALPHISSSSTPPPTPSHLLWNPPLTVRLDIQVLLAHPDPKPPLFPPICAPTIPHYPVLDPALLLSRHTPPRHLDHMVDGKVIRLVSLEHMPPRILEQVSILVDAT